MITKPLTTHHHHQNEPLLPPYGAIVLFDGVCNLCSSSVQFIIERDPQQYFRFAALQSDVGQQLLTQAGLSATKLNTIVLVEQQQAYTHSTAALRIAQQLSGGAWRYLGRLGMYLPQPLRDLLYNWVARNRYRWFGKQQSCWLPSKALSARFISQQ